MGLRGKEGGTWKSGGVGVGGNSVANERWEDGGSQIPKVVGAGEIEGHFPSDEKFGLINRKFPVSNGTVYSGISKKRGNLARYTQIFH